MASSKNSTVALPRGSRRLEANARNGTKKQLPSLSEHVSSDHPLDESTTSTCTRHFVSSHDLVTKYNIKRLTSWFKTWRAWQKRVFTCKVMEHCSKQHLELLATSLEPVLHFDFSSSFSAPLQSLYLDNMATFQVQRTILQNVVDPRVLDAKNSLSQLASTLSFSDSSSSRMDHLGSSVVGLKNPSNSKLHQLHSISDGNTSTLKASSNNEIKIMVTNSTSSSKVPNETILPSLPLIHIQHARGLNSEQYSVTSMEDLVTLQRKRFSSIPDFKSTTDLLRNIRQDDTFGRKSRRRHHQRASTIGTYHVFVKKSGEDRRQAELFKEQMAITSNWLRKWEKTETSALLLEVIKLCDKELLGYLVQCLYQRLQDKVSIDSLQDSILGKIFSYLDPLSLCKCAQVCRRWKRLSDMPSLWREMSRLLGQREGVGDLATAVESAGSSYLIQGVPSDASFESQTTTYSCGRESNELAAHEVDWKRAYRGLSKVMHQIKDLVVKSAKAAEQKELEDARALFNPTSAAIRSKYSLREMLHILQSRLPTSAGSTTQELLRLAPESAAAVRKRLRAERKAAVESAKREEEERLLSSRYEHRRPHVRGGSSRMTPMFGSSVGWSSNKPYMIQQLMSQIAEKGERSAGLSFEEEWKQRMSVLELIDVAIDMRPAVPYLPNVDGIQCLILAGLLMNGESPKPGRVQPIPKLRRLKQFNSTVLCLQSDQLKIVMGTEDREIRIHDIRSGRYVETLTGHKGSVQCLQFDHYKIVSGSWDTTVIVWDVVHFNAIKELHGHVDCVSCLQFDEEKLITGSLDKSLRVWSTSSWVCTAVVGNAHKSSITCLQFNKSIVASGGMDKCVKLWSTEGYHCLATLEHYAPISTLKLSNLLLISGTARSTPSATTATANKEEERDAVHVWNLHTNSKIITWPLASSSGCFITSFASNGNRVYGGGSDGALYEWDIATGTCIRTLVSHSKCINFVYAKDNKIITAAGDYTVCVWYTKKSAAVDDSSYMEDEDTDYVNIPIKVVTQS